MDYTSRRNNVAIRSLILSALLALSTINAIGQTRHGTVVADSLTRSPLPSASVFDRRGKVIGICDPKGIMPYIAQSDYPVTVRYMGYRERIVPHAYADTIFMQYNPIGLAEVVVESRRHKVMHMLAYVREYSTLTTYTDTVFMFREKMVDFMLNPDPKIKYKGWSYPRILKSKSYYRFTDAYGLDSVSDKCNHHFSWSDWIGVNARSGIPAALSSKEIGTDTIYGRYSPTEIWLKNDDKVSIDVDVLADTTSRKWVPNLSGFFRQHLDFEKIRVRFNYGNIVDNSISPMDLTGYSFNIESNGRGHSMFRFNRVDEPFFVSTYAEVYILDKEFITVKEAKRWEKHDFSNDDTELLVAAEAPEHQPYILDLIARVNAIDQDAVRLDTEPDRRLVSPNFGKKNNNFNINARALSILKRITGIASYQSGKKFDRSWNKFRQERMRKNNSRKNQE